MTKAADHIAPASAWFPIETAPKGYPLSTPMILLLEFTHTEDYDSSIYVGFWSTLDAHGEDPKEGWCDWGAGLDENDYWTEVRHPTHWMPLPPAPPVRSADD